MNAELYVDVTPEYLSLALTEDKRMVELRKEKSNIQFAVGDVYLGVITSYSIHYTKLYEVCKCPWFFTDGKFHVRTLVNMLI